MPALGEGHQLRYLQETRTGAVLTFCSLCGHHGQVRFVGLQKPCLKKQSKQLWCLKWLEKAQHPDSKKHRTGYEDITAIPASRRLYQRSGDLRGLHVAVVVHEAAGRVDIAAPAASHLHFDDEDAPFISEDERDRDSLVEPTGSQQ